MGDVLLAADLRLRGIRDEAVLLALASLDRSAFVPTTLRDRSWDDCPLPIGHGQTISQPYIVAFMSEALDVRPGMRVLEIGTGSGYQAAVLARMGAKVYSVERIGALLDSARAAFGEVGVSVITRVADGARGWPSEAPFDRIIVTAAATHAPSALIEQLADGGKLIAPVGQDADRQELILVERSAAGQLSWRDLLAVRFVPLIEGGLTPLA